MYKITMFFNGEPDEQDEEFETEEQARDYADYLCGCSREGAEVLHYSDPFEYPDEEVDDVEYEIYEVEDEEVTK